MELTTLVDYLASCNNSLPDHNSIQSCIKKLNIIPKYPIILVGGTNGKGSVCAYLSTLLSMAGYRVGSFTSPHVFKYNERICINNQSVDDFALVSALHEVINASQMHTTSLNLGLFRSFTLAAHLLFMQRNVDIAIFEVGIGGLNDITNLFSPTISAITNVALDHCEILGNTIDEIALQKAGIYRSGQYAFYGSINPPPNLVGYAKQIGAKFQQFEIDFGVVQNELSFDVWCQNKNYYTLPYPSLRGEAQANNVALALAVLNKLHQQFPISNGVIKTGLLKTTLVGRFQVIPGSPQVILDVAHNVHSVTNMLHNMLKLPFASRTVAVFGIAKDKNTSEIINLCRDAFDCWFIAKINNERGLKAGEIRHILKNNCVSEQNIIECETIELAYLKACEAKFDRIICFGSFLVVEEVYNTILLAEK